MARDREELIRLRKLKRLRELESKSSGIVATEPQLSFSSRTDNKTTSNIDPETGLILDPLTEPPKQDLSIGPSPQKLAEVASTPFRGTRGLGVGALQLARTRSPSEAVSRASEAVQPGFEPKGFTESVVSGISEAAPILPLAAGGGLPAAAGFAGQSAVTQKADTGEISPLQTAIAGGLGAFGGPVTKAAASTAKAAGKAIIPGSTKRIGEKIAEAEAKEGIRQVIPTVKSFAEDLGLPKGARSFSDIVNTVKAKLDAGIALKPQQLADFDELVNVMFTLRKISGKTKTGAVTAQTAREARKQLNKIIPGREALTKEFGKIKKIQKLIKRTSGVGAALGGAEAIRRFIVR